MKILLPCGKTEDCREETRQQRLKVLPQGKPTCFEPCASNIDDHFIALSAFQIFQVFIRLHLGQLIFIISSVVFAFLFFLTSINTHISHFTVFLIFDFCWFWSLVLFLLYPLHFLYLFALHCLSSHLVYHLFFFLSTATLLPFHNH